jgi:hypothetical protein
MTNQIYLLAIIAVVITHIILRCYLLLRFEWVGNDTYYHFVLGELIRKRGIRQLVNSRFIVPEHVDYPPLIPYLVSITPNRYLQLLQYVSPIADTITLMAISIAAWNWWGAPTALVAALVYASTPYTFDIAHSFNPRSIGNMFLSLALIILLVGNMNSAAEIATVSILGAMVLLTHRLTTQSLIICLIALCFFDITNALIIILSFLFAIFLSKIYYIVSIRGHISFLKSIGFSNIALSSYRKGLARIIQGNPHIFTFILIALTIKYSDTKTPMLQIWIVALFALAILWPFGEGDRHFANASSSVALLIGYASNNFINNLFVAIIIIIGFALIIIKNLLYPRFAAQGTGTIVVESLREGCTKIRASCSGLCRPLVLALPQSLSYQVMYFADARVVLASGGTGSGLAYNWQLRRRIQKDGLHGLSDNEQPDYLVCFESVSIETPEQDWQCMFQRAGLMIYRRIQHEQTTCEAATNHMHHTTLSRRI